MSLKDVVLPLLGNWTGVEEVADSGAAGAVSARAMFVFKLDVADRVVVQDYRQVRSDGGEYGGHGVLVAGPGDGEVAWWFFDSSGRFPEPAYGAWRDADLVLLEQTARGVAEHRFNVTADELRYVVRLRPDRHRGDESPADPTVLLSGRYRRVSGH